jgi:hypothetical protein
MQVQERLGQACQKAGAGASAGAGGTRGDHEPATHTEHGFPRMRGISRDDLSKAWEEPQHRAPPGRILSPKCFSDPIAQGTTSRDHRHG